MNAEDKKLSVYLAKIHELNWVQIQVVIWELAYLFL